MGLKARARQSTHVSIGDLWARLESFAVSHGRSLRLRGGASADAIAKVETQLGRAFPADFRDSLLLHDGQEAGYVDGHQAFEFLPGCAPLASIEAIARSHKEVVTLAAEFANDDEVEKGFDDDGMSRLEVFHMERIPIAGDPGDADNTFLDFAHGPNGSPGQVISLVTECDYVCLGNSFTDALECYVKALESGDWVYAADAKCVYPKSRRKDDFPHPADEFYDYRRG